MLATGEGEGMEEGLDDEGCGRKGRLPTGNTSRLTAWELSHSIV